MTIVVYTEPEAPLANYCIRCGIDLTRSNRSPARSNLCLGCADELAGLIGAQATRAP